MASKYDDLDASTELEQVLSMDLRQALEGRGCQIVHHGTNSGGRHSPGGKPDIEVRDHPNKRLILVEATRRKASSADGEFAAVTDHLLRAIRTGGYDDYGVLYVSPATSPRMSALFRDLWNRSRERDGRKGRVVALDFEAMEMMLTKLAEAPSDLYPASRLGELLARWDQAGDDSLARLLVQQAIFPEDAKLEVELKEEADEFAADRERRLKKQLEKIEDDLRLRGVVGDDANRVLVYLTFIRLYEERRQRLIGKYNRFTAEGFERWKRDQPDAIRNQYRDRMVEALLHEIAEDPDLRAAGLLRDSHGRRHSLHERVRDAFVVDKLFPVFDSYDFHVGRVDVLGAVFETLARRGEKDTRIGQFFTPQPVVNFAAGMVPLTPRDIVLDPAVGTARFLIQAMSVMLRAADSPAMEKAIRSERLLGTDIGSWVATIAKMNMYIHGDGKTNIREANGLVLGNRGVFPQFPDGLSARVDVVLTNPPLGETSHAVAVEDWAALGQSGEPGALLDRLGVIPMRVVEEQKLADWERRLAESESAVAALEAEPSGVGIQKQLRSARRTRDQRA
ncbi:MAG TPA: N-6 DNA methylase, partial [Actinomycetota bacterium]